MPKNDQPHGKSAEAHARRDEKLASRVWEFAGDDEHPAGQVNIIAKADHGSVTVRPVGGVDLFTVKRDLLTAVEGDDDEG